MIKSTGTCSTREGSERNLVLSDGRGHISPLAACDLPTPIQQGRHEQTGTVRRRKLLASARH